MQGRRSVLAPQGMVTAPHALASASGVRVLQDGGNAVEAAIAAAATIAVVYPHMNSIGGDNVWLVHDARNRSVDALLAIGTAGAACTIEAYRAAGCEREIPRRGPLAANTVPAAVDGWARAHRYSRERLAGRRSLASLLDDAIRYAEHGFPVTPSQAEWVARNVGANAAAPFGALERFAGWRQTFLKPDGTPHRIGERFALPDLAANLSEIARTGPDAFYRGPIAAAICRELRESGGLLTEADFAGYASRWAEPLSLPYRDWRLFNTPPPTQGLTALQILRILEASPVAAWRDDPLQLVHMTVEATKRAFVDRDRWIADPEHHPAPIADLLSASRARELAATIDPHRATVPPQPAPAPAIGGDTIALATVDAAGNAVSLIQSIYFDFGSAVIPAGTGVLLQNRGSSFSLDPSNPNAIAPGKRPFHTLSAAMALGPDGAPRLVYGTMGGEGQPQTQAAVLTRILDFGMEVQAAIDAPRWLYGRTWGAESSALSVEARFDPAMVAELRRRGHDVRVVGDWDETMGHAQAIAVDPDSGTRVGGADPRGDGIAVGH